MGCNGSETSTTLKVNTYDSFNAASLLKTKVEAGFINNLYRSFEPSLVVSIPKSPNLLTPLPSTIDTIVTVVSGIIIPFWFNT